MVILGNKMLFFLKESASIKKNQFLDYACNIVILGKAPHVVTPTDLFVFGDIFMLPSFSITKLTVIGESDVLIHPNFVLFDSMLL